MASTTNDVLKLAPPNAQEKEGSLLEDKCALGDRDFGNSSQL